MHLVDLSSIALRAGVFFVIQTLFINVLLINQLLLTYRSHPGLYIVLYASLSAIFVVAMVDGWNTYINHITVMYVMATIVMYAWFCHQFQVTGGLVNALKRFRIPTSQSQILDKAWSCGVVKVSEIVWQQTIALSVVVLLLDSGVTYLWAGIYFAVVVCILHLSTLRLQGPVCGSFFTVASTIGALCYPWVLASGTAGLGMMVLIHTLAYMGFYTYLGRKLQQVHM